MKFAGWYGIGVGLLMFGQWGFFLATGQVSEVQTEPIRLAFHLAAEWTTALALVIGGIAVWKRWRGGTTVYLVGTGMLAYSAIVSPGYFAQQGQWVFVVMFAVILGLAIISFLQVARSQI